MLRRKLFIRDLFCSNSFLNNFSCIEFENLKTFVECIKTNILSIDMRNLIIPIKTIEDFDIFCKIIDNTYLCDKTLVNLYIETYLLEDIFKKFNTIRRKNFNIITTTGIKPIKDYLKIDGFKEWVDKNPLFIEIPIKFNNFLDAINSIAMYNVISRWRFFKLKWDFESFEDAKFGDLHEIEFWLHELNNWMMDSKNKGNRIEFFNTLGMKTIFVGEDLKLYLTKEAFQDNVVLFDLKKHLNDNGETISFIELNDLRVYLDLKKEYYELRKVKNYLIDFYQNLKLMGNLNELPYIVKFIGDILDA